MLYFFSIVLFGTSAAPPDSVTQPRMEAMLASGQARANGPWTTADGVTYVMDDDEVEVSGLSPGLCRLLFKVAVRNDDYVLTDSLKNPIKIEAVPGDTPADWGPPVLVATPAELCKELHRRLGAEHPGTSLRHAGRSLRRRAGA